MLELKNICFERDNKKILDNVNLKLDDNKFIVITGPNGSGKSTLAKIIMGIEKQDSGQVILGGKDITKKSIDKRAKSGIGFAFQQPVRFKGITVFDLLKLSAEKDITRKDACEILSKVGLCAKEYVDREVNSSLSGGELKLILILQTLNNSGDVIIFDETTNELDTQIEKEVLTMIKKDYKDKIIIIISHKNNNKYIFNKHLYFSSDNQKNSNRRINEKIRY